MEKTVLVTKLVEMGEKGTSGQHGGHGGNNITVKARDGGTGGDAN